MIILETKKTRGNNHYRVKPPPPKAKTGFTHLNTVIDRWNYLDPDRLFYIYRHIRLDTGKPFYVGVGKKASFTSHKREYRRAFDVADRNIFWKRIAKKTEYVVEIVVENLTYEESRQREVEFVKLYGRRNIGTGELVNLTDGGDGFIGYEFTEEVRKKMSKSQTGRKRFFTEDHKKNIGEKSRGRYFSPEVREKKRKSMTGKKYPPEVAQKKREARLKHCKQVLCLDTGFVFDCALGVGKAMFPLHWHSAGARITVVCNGKTDAYKGFHFCYV